MSPSSSRVPLPETEETHVVDVDKDNSNSDQDEVEVTGVGRKRKSKVWKHFTILPGSNFNDGIVRAKCNHCGLKNQAKGSNGTSNFKRHLRKCSRLHNHDPLQLMVSNSGKLAARRIDMEEYREKLAYVAIHHAYPFQFVEHEHFRILLSYLNEDAKPVCRNTLKSVTLKIHEREKLIVKSILESLPGKICLTSDMWTSATTKGYLCLTAHYVDVDWKLHCLILNFHHVPPPHSARNLHNVIYDLLKEWGIEKKIFSITLDNARTNDNMQDILLRSLSTYYPLPCGGEFFHVRCSAHILNLIVQEGLKLIDSGVKKTREAVKYVTGTEGREISFMDCARRVGCDLSKGLRSDSLTRWNSTQLMLERALIYRQVFTTFASEDKNFTWSLTDVEWVRVERICALLKPFTEITTLLSGSNYPTANLYFSSIWKIELILQQEVKSGDAFMREMAEDMKEKFDKYWDCYSMVLSFAVILDPCCKLDYVKFCYKKLDEVNYIEKVDEVVQAMEKLYNEYAHDQSVNNNPIQTIIDNNSSSKSKDADSEFFELSRPSSSRSELQRYFEETRLPRQNSFDILQWWQANEQRYPTIACMARDILSIPITTVASESAFSLGGRVLTKFRHKLLPENAEALITTRSWLNGVENMNASEEEVEGEEFVLDTSQLPSQKKRMRV